MKATRRFTIWKGPSELDGKPIMLVATLGAQNKENKKTGRMWQTYILRSDMNPVQAAQEREDASICGSCPHKLKENGTCYVRLDTGPLMVYKAVQRGVYPQRSLVEAQDLFAGEVVRMGSYGDPCAVPFSVWSIILGRCKGHTGYTHCWKDTRFQSFAGLLMASCDNLDEDAQAKARHWRTFTVVSTESYDTRHGLPVVPNSFLCPASKQAGQKLTCSQCLACDGNSTGRKASVYIPVHGVAYKVARFNTLITIGRPS